MKNLSLVHDYRKSLGKVREAIVGSVIPPIFDE